MKQILLSNFNFIYIRDKNWMKFKNEIKYNFFFLGEHEVFYFIFLYLDLVGLTWQCQVSLSLD